MKGMAPGDALILHLWSEGGLLDESITEDTIYLLHESCLMLRVEHIEVSGNGRVFVDLR